MALPNPHPSPALQPVSGAPEGFDQENRRKLIHVLQMAYSGEKSAALAYQGHAASKVKPQERETIQRFEREEWHHRERVGKMLAQIGGTPSAYREVMQVMIGRCIKVICPWCGWHLPMLGAWLLEENNILEYEHAAGYARALGLNAMADELMTMSGVEREHAVYFRDVFLDSVKRLLQR